MRGLGAFACLTWLLAAPLVGQERRQTGYRVAPDVAVRIMNLVGAVSITGWDRDSIDVVAEIESGGGRFYGGGSGRIAKLGLEGQDPAGLRGARLLVRVPREARVWVKSSTAPVELTGLDGEVEVTTVLGSVRLAGAARVATIETIDGDVRVQGPATVVRIRTGGGNAEVVGVRGDLAVTTVQGRITIVCDQILSARAESVSGRVEVRTTVAPGGRLEIQTHDGDVHVTLPAPADARFDLSSIAGPVITRLFDAPERVYRKGTAQFAVGPGAGTSRSGLVSIRSFKGTIRVDTNPKSPGGV